MTSGQLLSPVSRCITDLLQWPILGWPRQGPDAARIVVLNCSLDTISLWWPVTYKSVAQRDDDDGVGNHDVVFFNTVRWPGEKFALPHPVYNCPELHWAPGSARMEWDFGNHIDITWSPDFHVIGPYGQRQQSDLPTTVLSFMTCAVETEESGNKVNWPDGNYCVYKMGNTCPAGKEMQISVLLLLFKYKFTTIWFIVYSTSLCKKDFPY